MEILELINEIPQLNAATLSVVFFASGILLTGLYYIRRAAKSHLDKIQKIKQAKDLLVNQLTSTLMALQNLNAKLIKQKDVLDSFEDDTIIDALQEVNNIRSKYGIFNYLNEPKLVKQIVFFFDGKKKLLEEMLLIEKESYEFQLQYQEKLITYNRELENLKNSNTSEFDLAERKREILKELEKTRAQVTNALNTLREKRAEYYTELSTSKSIITKLQTELEDYKQKNIANKRFYPRYLAFA